MSAVAIERGRAFADERLRRAEWMLAKKRREIRATEQKLESLRSELRGMEQATEMFKASLRPAHV